ncbi:hypothetical protein N7540_005744 [Penicillium herquei]|nr:hypothetical protein N7540_005744 [Penicillium herquei]
MQSWTGNLIWLVTESFWLKLGISMYRSYWVFLAQACTSVDPFREYESGSCVGVSHLDVEMFQPLNSGFSRRILLPVNDST